MRTRRLSAGARSESRGEKQRHDAARRGPLLSVAALLVGLGSIGCHAPHVHIESTPSAALWRDGKPLAASTPTDFAAPYFGRMRVDVEHDAGPEIMGTRYLPKTVYVDVPSPLNRWIFPFDFPVELFQHLFGDRNQRIEVELEQAPPNALDDRGVAELIRACRAAAVER